MANQTTITVIGNLVDDPELKFISSGAAVANFRIASTPRQFDKASNEWKDGDAMFLSCSVWREQAENVAETLRKGQRVIVTGALKARTYETSAGEKRTVFEVEVDEVGPSLRFGNRNRGGGSAPARTQAPAAPAYAPATNDPWATAAPSAGGEPPF